MSEIPSPNILQEWQKSSSGDCTVRAAASRKASIANVGDAPAKYSTGKEAVWSEQQLQEDQRHLRRGDFSKHHLKLALKTLEARILNHQMHNQTDRWTYRLVDKTWGIIFPVFHVQTNAPKFPGTNTDNEVEVWFSYE